MDSRKCKSTKLQLLQKRTLPSVKYQTSNWYMNKAKECMHASNITAM